MNDVKSMIEIVKIDGYGVAVERQSNNCWVSLTDMAKRYGKQVAHWLELKSTQDYLSVARRKIYQKEISDIGKAISGNKRQEVYIAPEPIITRKGGRPHEQGTWATDYRVANRFAQWLSPEYAWEVDDVITRIMSGERIVSEDGFFVLGGKQWVSCFDYCKMLHRSAHSFYGLKGHYPKDFIFWDGQWYMSRDLFNMKDWQARYENRRLDMRSKYDDTQLAIPFESETKQEG